MIKPYIIHTSNKATVYSIILAVESHNHSSKVEHVVFKIENIVETRGCAVNTMLAVHRYLGAIAVSLQFDYVPFAIVDYFIIQPHQTFATAEIKSKLHVAFDNFKNAKVYKSTSI